MANPNARLPCADVTNSTLVEALLGLGHHQRDVIRGALQDVHGRRAREALQAHVVHREQAVACTDTDTDTHTHTLVNMTAKLMVGR